MVYRVSKQNNKPHWVSGLKLQLKWDLFLNLPPRIGSRDFLTHSRGSSCLCGMNPRQKQEASPFQFAD